jgi:meiotically up-regulated gene 157 (Mug157) protein
MIYSAFRPSDDACVYGYLIPSNIFFLSELDQLNASLKTAQSEKLANEIRSGLAQFAIIDGRYAYEVDGLGNSLSIDDANIPSLLSLPLLSGNLFEDRTYAATRKFILSENNPYYFSGSKAAGIGSLHTPKNFVWPIAIAVQALTDPATDKKLETLDLLERTDGGTGNMHEAFDVDNPDEFTRAWFSWAIVSMTPMVRRGWMLRIVRRCSGFWMGWILFGCWATTTPRRRHRLCPRPRHGERKGCRPDLLHRCLSGRPLCRGRL